MHDATSDIRTIFHYLYRDAGNFKVFGSVSLRGRLDDTSRAAILAAMDEDGRFVAEQVNVPTLYEPLHQYTHGPSYLDVCTHEFSHFEETQEPASSSNEIVWGNSTDFSATFESVEEWRFGLSVNATSLLSKV